MERQPFVLGLILRKCPEFRFGMNEFNDRLRLQKFVYLLQAHDIYLGYDFSWYIRGPYCTILATAGFALEDFYDDIPKGSKNARFANRTIQNRFDKFVAFIRGMENDAKFLEAAASLHFLLKTRRVNDDEAVSKVGAKMPGADTRYLRRVLDRIKLEGLL